MKYALKDVHPQLRFGTASDRYAGWIGQIYPDAMEAQVTTRKKKLAGRTFEERLVPVESTSEYFKHFAVLEIDFTYYRPLIDVDGSELSTLHLIRRYIEHAPNDALFLLKVPRMFFSRWLRTYVGGKPGYTENAEYLSIDHYLPMFHDPAVSILGSQLAGLVFEQEYQRKGDTPEIDDYVADLEAFFSGVPDNARLHIELRSEHLLQPTYFEWLESRGIGHVFSHWTWLPPIRKQWALAGERFTGKSDALVRLLTPLRVPYADAYAKTWPFDAVVPEVADTRQAHQMIDDTAALAFQAIEQGKTLNIVANNRAWGNAPELAQTVADRIMAEMRRRAQERP